jgi:glycosyltransferase involved in cell wall biosynthesis
MSHPARIVFCILSMGEGGTEKQLIKLIRGLDHTRFEPLLCTLRPIFMDLKTLDCQFLELLIGSLGSVSALQELRRLRRFVRDQRVDIIQTFFEDPTVFGLLGSLGHQVRVRVAGIRDLGFSRTWKKVPQLRLAYPHFDGFIANSQAAARQANALDRIPLEKIEVIYNGVALPPTREPYARHEPPLVGVVAHLNRQVKRVDLFLHAASHVRQQVPTARFLVVGDGHLRQELESLAQRLGLGSSVEFAGHVSDVVATMRLLDVGVLCSDSEGFPNTVLEYMACGVPTVARKVGGNEELVSDRETGMLVDSDRPEAIAEAVLALLRDEELSRTVSARARRLVEDSFSVEACVARHEDYYERLLRSSTVRKQYAGPALDKG